MTVRRSLENFDVIMGTIAMHTDRIFPAEASEIIIAIQNKRRIHTRRNHEEMVSPELESLLCRLVPILPADIRRKVESVSVVIH